jgi:hypothetical protein
LALAMRCFLVRLAADALPALLRCSRKVSIPELCWN